MKRVMKNLLVGFKYNFNVSQFTKKEIKNTQQKLDKT